MACLCWLAQASPEWEPMEEILNSISDPVFPDRQFVITGFGAKPDSGLPATDAINRAILACHAAGGGKVIVPAGTYLTGAIHLKSNVNLVLSEGATLLFSTDPADYLPLVHTRWEGVERFNYSPLIYAFEQENIAVTGKGTLDGQAAWDNWWGWNRKRDDDGKSLVTRQAAPRLELFRMAAEQVPVAQRVMGEGAFLRPNFIQPYRCRNVLIEGITILRSPMWEVHPVLCENFTVRGISVVSHGPNNDGCNPESSRNVLIEDCTFDTGDDCIAIKSGRNDDGRRIGVPSENIVIRNCTMKEVHGGVVIGIEISGDCRNVFIENCHMSSPNLDRALRIKTNSIRGGVIENIFARNIHVGQVKDAVVKINFHYEEGDAGPFTPVVRNVLIQQLTVSKAPRVLDLRGYDDSPISGVRLIDCRFEGISNANVLINVRNLTLDNVDVNTGLPLDSWGNPLTN